MAKHKLRRIQMDSRAIISIVIKEAAIRGKILLWSDKLTRHGGKRNNAFGSV